MSRAIPPLTLWVFAACSMVTFTFTMLFVSQTTQIGASHLTRDVYLLPLVKLISELPVCCVNGRYTELCRIRKEADLGKRLKASVTVDGILVNIEIRCIPNTRHNNFCVIRIPIRRAVCKQLDCVQKGLSTFGKVMLRFK